MSEEKVNFFHKILIVIVMIFVFSKLSKIKLPSLENLLSRKSEPERKVVVQPETRVIREYIQVPVQAPQVAPRQVFTNDTTSAPRPYSPPCTAPIMPPNTIRIDDDTFRKFF